MGCSNGKSVEKPITRYSEGPPRPLSRSSSETTMSPRAVSPRKLRITRTEKSTKYSSLPLNGQQTATGPVGSKASSTTGSIALSGRDNMAYAGPRKGGIGGGGDDFDGEDDAVNRLGTQSCGTTSYEAKKLAIENQMGKNRRPSFDEEDGPPGGAARGHQKAMRKYGQ
eukprot:PhF_6_TR35109/c1_g1_i1/m.51180